MLLTAPAPLFSLTRLFFTVFLTVSVVILSADSARAQQGLGSLPATLDAALLPPPPRPERTLKAAKKDMIIEELEFKDAKVQDAVRVIAELTGVNVVATNKAGKAVVTVFVRDLTVAEVVDSICRISGLWYRFNLDTGIFLVMTTEEYQRDIVVYRYEPTRMFQLKYLNVGIAARTIYDLFGERVELLGKANRHLGSDYDVGESASLFYEDFDEGQQDDDGENNVSNRSRNTTRRRTSTSSRYNNRQGNRSITTGDLNVKDLTPGQLSVLQELAEEELQSLIVSEGKLGRLASRRREAPIYVTVNRLHNLLFVRTADEKAMEEIAKIIEDSDREVPEVLLEMKVLAVQLNNNFESAFDISNISGSQQTGPDDGHATNPLNPSSETVGSSLLGLGNYGLMEDATMVFQALSGNLRVRIQLLEEQGDIQTLSTPMLLAANNHPARLFIGEQTVLTTGFESQEVNVASGSGTTVVDTLPVPVTEVVEVGNTLSILPSINADRSVVMRIIHENSTVVVGGGSIPLVVGDEVQNVAIDTVDTATMEGTVLAQDGMTIAVGGMIRTSYQDVENKVPVLGDIPGLGFFFKEQQKQEEKFELVLLITPHVIRAPDQGEDLTRRRLADLSDYASKLDIYLDKVDGTRSEAGLPEPNSLQQRFIELTQVAMKQVRLQLIFRQPEGNVRPIAVLDMGAVPLFNDPQIVSKPVGAWTNGFHYVTALKVRNRSASPLQLDAGDINGSWRAATLEKKSLASAGEEGDFTYLYLISDTKFEDTIYGKPQ